MEITPKRNWQFPLALEREYAKLLVAYVDKEMEIVEEFLPEMADAVYRNSVRSDAVGDWLGNLVDRVQRKIKQKLNVLPAIRRIFQKVNQHVSKQMTETFESVFGTRPRQLNNTRELEMTKTIWTSQNLTLISSIDQQVLDKLRFMLSQRIIHAAAKPELMEQLTKEISDLAGVTRNRAALIGADQVGKLNSQLMQYRQTNAGIEEYIWTTKKDKRVRPRHALREGRCYKWSEPPDDGHPGWPIRCRCTAAPVFDTDKMGVQPKAGSYLSIPDINKPSRRAVSTKDLSLEPKTPEMETLFQVGESGRIYEMDESFDRPFCFAPGRRKVVINPTHEDFRLYDFSEAIAHETVHWLDYSMRWSRSKDKSTIKEFDDAIRAAGEYVLRPENRRKYEPLITKDFAENMSISDIFSNITLNEICGCLGHDTEGYWLKYPESRRYELLGGFLTIYTIGDKAGEQIIEGIPALKPLYEKWVKKYVTFLRGYKKAD